MPKAYISSTFKDLQQHRQIAINTLDRLGFSTRAMEKYFASDERPKDLCLADVAECDLYVGIFAWRYGTIPRDGEDRSITECEFREAERRGIPCLLFLSDGADCWPVDSADDRSRIARLREELAARRTCAFFDTPEKLGLEISVAVARWQRDPDLRHYLRALVTEFADLPDLPGRTKNLAINEIMSMAVSLPGRDEGQPVIVELATAVEQHRALLLVGGGGFGKSTALRFLAHRHAVARLESASDIDPSTWIPIYVRLRTTRLSIREQLWAAMQRTEFHCSREIFDRWLAEQPFLLLIDRLDGLDAGSTLEEVAELLQQTERARIVVATRPHESLTDSSWVSAALQLPSEAALVAFFKTLLGSQSGGELFDLLARQDLIGLFRRPLFARFVALSSPVLRQEGFSPAAVFQDVIERRFLTDWEGANDVKYGRPILQEFLARLAHSMLVGNVDSVSPEEALTIARDVITDRRLTTDPGTLQGILKQTLTCGILTKTDGRIQFWHAAFRDYFAAVWLERNKNRLQIYRRSWTSHWHECLVYYFGLLKGRRLERAMRMLLFGLPVNIAMLRLGPNPRMTGRLLLVLRCMVDAGETGRRWHAGVLRRLPELFRHFFLSGASTPIIYGERYDAYAPHRYLCDLIGQLKSPEGFAYLDRVHAGLENVAPGLLHSPDNHVIQRLADALVIDAPTDEPRHPSGDKLLAHLLLRSRDPRCYAALRHVACAQGAAARTKLLTLLFRTMSWHRHDLELRQVLLTQWSELLVGFTLHDDDENARKAAIAFLRELGPSAEYPDESLPRQAYQTLLEVLSGENALLRARALAAFRVPELEQHLNVVAHFLDDDDIGVVFNALFHFRYSAKPQEFGRAVLRVLRRHATDDVRTSAAMFYEALRKQYPHATMPRRVIAFLMGSALRGRYNGFTLYAVLALGLALPDRRQSPNLISLQPSSPDASDWAVPFLTYIVRGVGFEETRCAALDILIRFLKSDAADLVVEMLSDPAPRMRGDAAADCFIHDFGANFPPRVGAHLFSLVKDEDEFTSRYATLALKKWGYLAKDWYHFYGEPVYLGPRSR